MQGLEEAIEAAHKYVADTDRAAYMWAFRAIESAVNSDDALYMGGIATAALASSGAGEYVCDIGLRNKGVASTFLDAVCSAGRDLPDLFIVLRTTIDDREYALDINGRTIVRMTVIGRRGDVDIIDRIPRKTVDSPITGNKITVCGADIAMMDVARTLYTAALAGEWEGVMAVFRSISPSLLESRTGGSANAIHIAETAKTAIELAGIIGAAQKRRREREREHGREREREHVREHHKDILPAGAILIGDAALKQLGLIDAPRRHLQCLSNMPIGELAKRVERKVGRPVRVVRYWTGIPSDFQLSKHTIYVLSPGREDGGQRPILDVYNSPSYEMIPLAKGGGHAPIAGLFVLLRFLLVDLWILRMIDGSDRVMGYISDGIGACVSGIADARPGDLWPVERDRWAGVFTKEQPAKMRIFGMSKTAPQTCPP
jgi:hypothetical protein